MFSLKYLTVFAFAACNLTLILARPRPGKTNSETDLVGNCIDRQISVTETVKVANHLLNITVPACSDTFVPGDNAVDLKNSLLARHVFQARNLAANMERDVERRVHEAPNASPFECSNPAICQCALPCTTVCGTGSSPPDPPPSLGDCENLAAVIRLFHESIGPTFVQGVGFPNPIIIDFSTCRAIYGNIRTDGTPIEECWDGLADNLVSMINVCIAPHLGNGGLCTATNNLWVAGIGALNRMA
ncbi:hypothetical protein NLI96_g6949 [Meripilus lineatus]|uniref:Uncharacterized protein n=1 Tax=Meripilus lineatus TaxID=2056292 RepID=A0AAD5YHP4_9APHY|nr:hypothetical protein NLI96_g6949 [Physisporinus lineatus]